MRAGSDLPPTQACASLLSCVRLSATPWTVARQAPLSMGLSRKEHWSGLPCPPPWDRPNPGIQPRSPSLQVDSLPFEPPGSQALETVSKRLVALASLFTGTSRGSGEGSGNPLQSSCLENPRDRGAWWAAVHGVAQSRTRLK